MAGSYGVRINRVDSTNTRSFCPVGTVRNDGSAAERA